jgi:hypothetical protein
VNASIVLLSSGLRTQYREDMIRALAMPEGATLRFRYRHEHLPESISAAAGRNALCGRHVVLTFAANANRRSEEPAPIPCRFAQITESRDAGRYAVLNLELRSYAFARDLKAFRAKFSEEFPRWSSEPKLEDRCLEGLFAHEVLDIEKVCEARTDNESWQEIASQLKQTDDFQQEPFFYRVEKLYDLTRDRCVRLDHGAYSLKPGRRYEFRLLHYDPSREDVPLKTVQESLWLIVENQGRGLERLTSGLLAIDSPYDEKRVQFKSRGLSSSERGLVGFYRIKVPSNHPSVDGAVRDFELQVNVGGRFWTTVGVAGLIGLLLAGQQWLTVKSTKGAWPELDMGLLQLLIASIAALVAAFGLRKPD